MNCDLPNVFFLTLFAGLGCYLVLSRKMDSSRNKRLVVIAGPTAVGKTSLAIELALRLKTEIISADSRQLFRELNIGTAKPTQEELKKAKQHFIDSHSIHDDYSAGQFGRDALQLISGLFERHDYVILCGGSGLYIKAVCEGFDEMPVVEDAIRQKIIEEYNQKGIEWLQEQVAKADPDYFKTVDRKNPHRLMRALELNYATGIAVSTHRKKKKSEHPFSMIKVGLEIDRKQLYERIDRRMDEMIEAGLFEEAKSLHPYKHLNALQTVGYQEIFDYMDGKYDKEEAIRLLKRNSRRYAKRQLTWFKRDKDMKWFSPDDLKGVIGYIQSVN